MNRLSLAGVCCVHAFLLLAIPAQVDGGRFSDENKALSLEGYWRLRCIVNGGRWLDLASLRDSDNQWGDHPLIQCRIRGASWLAPPRDGRDGAVFCTIRLNPQASPNSIDLIRKEGTWKGIYKVTRDTMEICIDIESMDAPRPTSFGITGASDMLRLEFDRSEDPLAKKVQKTPDLKDVSVGDVDDEALRRLNAEELQILHDVYKDMRIAYEHGRANYKLHSAGLRRWRPKQSMLSAITKLDNWFKDGNPRVLSDQLVKSYEANMRESEERSESYMTKIERMEKNLLLIDKEKARRKPKT